MTTVLVINTGSASIKYALVCTDGSRPVEGLLDGIGSPHARLRQKGDDTAQAVNATDHASGMVIIFDRLRAAGRFSPDAPPDVIGHRVVHGGNRYNAPIVIDDQVIAELTAIRQLSPLHTAVNLTGIRIAREQLPDTPHVAVFDTAFHHDLPPAARHYALPLALQKTLGIRRFGFHGLSHQAVAQAAAQQLQQPLSSLKLITLHLGNGASACAIRHGQSVDTTMGFTPTEGLVMGSRCGDIDPTLPGYIADQLALPPAEIERLLNQQSGLRGLCGDNDMRRIEASMAAGDTDAQLAFTLFCYRIRKTIGAYIAVLNGIDALVFTGGIGEHSAAVRSAVCDQLDALGIQLDPTRNANDGNDITLISPNNARIPILVIASNEAQQIADAAIDCLTRDSRRTSISTP